MKSFILLFSIALLFQNDWTTYSSQDGQFQIDSPGAFIEKIDSINTEVGKMAYHTLFYKSENTDENDIYMLSYCDYNVGFEFADSTGMVADFFQTTMDAAVTSVDGTILYDSDIQLNNYPGKLWRIDFNEGKAVAKTKAFLVKNRYYAVQVISFDDEVLGTDAERFFNSFKLF